MYQYGFRKSINQQYWNIAMLEKWNLRKDKESYFGALLTYLSNAIDCFFQVL